MTTPSPETIKEWAERPEPMEELYREWVMEGKFPMPGKIEKGRRYVDDPSEAPEGVEVQEGPQGGYFYETDGASGDDRGTDRQQSGGEFIGEFDLNTHDALKEDIQSVTGRMEQFYDLSNLERITTDPPQVVSGDEMGKFQHNPDTVWINPDKLNPIEIRDAYDSGFLATPDVEGLITHELIHAAHAQNIRQGDYPSTIEFEDESERELVEAEVSKYAGHSPLEMVAEVGAYMEQGNDVSDEVMELYRKYGGPE